MIQIQMRSLLADFVGDEIAMKVYSREMNVCIENQKITQQLTRFQSYLQTV